MTPVTHVILSQHVLPLTVVLTNHAGCVTSFVVFPRLRGHVLQCGKQKIRVGLLPCHWQPAETEGFHFQQTSASLKSGSHVHSSTTCSIKKMWENQRVFLTSDELKFKQSAKLHLFSIPNSALSMLDKKVLNSGFFTTHQTSAIKRCSAERDFSHLTLI